MYAPVLVKTYFVADTDHWVLHWNYDAKPPGWWWMAQANQKNVGAVIQSEAKQVRNFTVDWRHKTFDLAPLDGEAVDKRPLVTDVETTELPVDSFKHGARSFAHRVEVSPEHITNVFYENKTVEARVNLDIDWDGGAQMDDKAFVFELNIADVITGAIILAQRHWALTPSNYRYVAWLAGTLRNFPPTQTIAQVRATVGWRQINQPAENHGFRISSTLEFRSSYLPAILRFVGIQDESFSEMLDRKKREALEASEGSEDSFEVISDVDP